MSSQIILSAERIQSVSPDLRENLDRQLAEMEDLAKVIKALQSESARLHSHAIWRVSRALLAAERRRHLRTSGVRLSDEEFDNLTQEFTKNAFSLAATQDVMMLHEFRSLLAQTNSLPSLNAGMTLLLKSD